MSLRTTTLCLFSMVMSIASHGAGTKDLVNGIRKDGPSVFLNFVERNRWPSIESKSYIDLIADEEKRQEKGALLLILQELHSRLLADSAACVDTDGASFSREIGTMSALAGQLFESGGYSNVTLAETCCRLAVSLLCNRLIGEPAAYAAIGEDLAALQQSIPDFFVILRELSQSNEFSSTINPLLPNLSEDIPIEGLLQVIFPRTPLSELVRLDRKTTVMLEKSNLPVLLLKIAHVQCIADYSLPHLINFYRLGGRDEYANIGDITEFKRIMKGQRMKYRFPLLEKSKLYPDEFDSIRILFSDLQSSPFYMEAQ